jgi:LPXTG-motif cell wall-anchored protein
MKQIMKKMRKVLALVISMVMMMAMAMPAFAQTVGTASTGTGSITISNAAKGETYAVYKLFDATVSTTTTSGGESTSIAYTGTIPSGLSAYFVKDSAGNITATAAAKASDGSLTPEAVAALTAWTSGKTADASATSDGSELTFAGLPYGYYVVTTTQGNTAISVDSTRPNATIIDKNTTPPVNNLSKSADETDVYIGQTVTYTVSFNTANYDGTKQIVKYEITDAPAANSLTNITVTEIKVGSTPIATQQFSNGKITINWTENGVAGQSLYANGAKLEITYTGVVADTAAIDGAGNKNTVTVKPILDDGTSPDPSTYTDDETFFTYAIALKKVDQSGQPLSGAKFQLPFYVKETAASDGAYVYAGTTAGTGLVNELTTPASGLIIIKGVKTGDYSITETEAPNGYNKLTAPVIVTATKTGQTTTSTTTYLDADGNIVNQEVTGGSTVLVTIQELAATPVVVVNKTGVELPSTGGIGTTIFYVVGAMLIIGAGVVLITRRRMNAQ